MTVDPELVDRFRADLQALIDLEGGKLGIAYSGGPDSLALLVLASAAFPGQVEAATVDHALRAESADEAALASKNCGQLGVAHEVLKVSVKAGNLQSEARRARYAALTAWAREREIGYILTAHHADDQAETFLMRANRGSGLFGLAGVRPISPSEDAGITVARPLLAWRRETLESVARASDLAFADDPSNRDDSFDRVRMRKALANASYIDVSGLATSAGLLSAFEDDVLGMVLEEWAASVEEVEGGVIYRPYSRSIISRPMFWAEIVRIICEDFGASATRRDASRIVDSLLEGQPINIAGVQARESDLGGEKVWKFTPENPRRGS